jgi:hypothetical protein
MMFSVTIQLLQIFEDEWVKSSEVIKRKILHLCGQTPPIKIGARLLVISEATKTDLEDFVNTNHLQGMPRGASHYLKITYKNKMVAAVTLKRVSGVTVEMTRFCSDQSGTFPGLMSKIVAYVGRNYEYSELITFADLRYSTGDVFRKCGFTEVDKLAPDYFYVIGESRAHKMNLEKASIDRSFDIDPIGETELQKAAETGLKRIWDCGRIKYSIALKPAAKNLIHRGGL